MTRKGKLVPSEKIKKVSCYGTQTTRLSAHSQLKFGYCCLQLEPAVDPVATPSGHIYSREAIVSYLLAKTQELQEERRKYQQKRLAQEAKKQEEESEQVSKRQRLLLLREQGGVQEDTKSHSSSLKQTLNRHIDTETVEEGRNVLKRTSYWLADSQPSSTAIVTVNSEKHKDADTPTASPPERPQSPMSGNPLRLKDLTPLSLKSTTENDKTFFHCALTDKIISTQPAIVIKKTKQVMLKSAFDKLVKPTMICPITSVKFKNKDILELVKASSGFVASGNVEVKKYIPTLT